jgi:hypothetical protein
VKFLDAIYPLFGSFGLVIEFAEFEDSPYFVSLIELDFYGVTCKKLQTLEYHCDGVDIFVNKFDATDFVLQLRTDGEYVARVCKLAKKSIIVGDPIQLPDCFESYFDGFLYYICYANQEDDDWIKVCLFVSYLLNN